MTRKVGNTLSCQINDINTNIIFIFIYLQGKKHFVFQYILGLTMNNSHLHQSEVQMHLLI